MEREREERDRRKGEREREEGQRGRKREKKREPHMKSSSGLFSLSPSPRGTSSTMIREVEKKPLAVLEMPVPGQLATSSLILWNPSMMVTPPTWLHTPAVVRERGESERVGGMEGGKKGGRGERLEG